MAAEQRNKWVVLAEGLLTTATLTVVDYLTTWELSFSVFYVLVIVFTSYRGGIVVGTIVAVACTAGWTVSDYLGEIPYTIWYAHYWNVGVKISMLLLLAYMTVRLRKASDLAHKLARTDPLTGVWNRRYFNELMGVELQRARRYKHAMTVVYIDLDDFKVVNDTWGHPVGDDLLRTVAHTIQSNLRAPDSVARLGGDEFAVLLSETGQEAASSYLDKMQRQLLEAMREHGWSITFSIGAMTYLEPPRSIDEVISQADRFMYSAKREGKGKIKHAIVEEVEEVEELEEVKEQSPLS
jgi:diguanylate cyclase (GGDEF)-like protein